jgi:hypothetical protein
LVKIKYTPFLKGKRIILSSFKIYFVFLKPLLDLTPYSMITNKLVIGILAGAFLGIFITSIFEPDDTVVELFLTKITASSMITGLLCGIYAHFSKSKLQVFLISILIGTLTFYLKYILTGHDYDPITMGVFVGTILGGFFVALNKITESLKAEIKLKKMRRRGFINY